MHVHEFLLWAGGVIVSIGSGLVGWIFKMVFSQIRRVETDNKLLQKSLQEHKLHAAETFATRQEVNAGFDRIMTKLDTIDEKLDRKADK